MEIQRSRAAVDPARSALTRKVSGIWQAVRAHIDGRNAVHLERERRITLLTVPAALPPGTQVQDLRADGSVLEMRVPPIARIDVLLEGNTDHSTSQIAFPSLGPPGQDSTRGHIGTAQTVKE